MNPELLYVPPTNCGTENVDLATVPLDCFFGPYWVREDTSDVLQVSVLGRMMFGRPQDGMPAFFLAVLRDGPPPPPRCRGRISGFAVADATPCHGRHGPAAPPSRARPPPPPRPGRSRASP